MTNLNNEKLMAAKIRFHAVDAIHTAASGHPGGSLSCADILAVLYSGVMNIDSENPHWEDRDRFVLSKGHCAPALYAALALRGFFPVETLQELRSIKSHLSGHPDMQNVPGVDMSTGSLGQGLSAAVGMALTAKITGKSYNTYVICGDGELNEGQIWEAAMAAAKWKLNNLCVFVDINGLQIDGTTDEVMPTAPVDKKFEAFNWNVITIDGHDLEKVHEAIEFFKNSDKPTAVIASTVKGKGVSFMENQVGWHGKAPDDAQYAVARAELEAAIKELEEN